MAAAARPAVLPGPGRSAPPAARPSAAPAPAPGDRVAAAQSAAGACGGGCLRSRRRGISICSSVHGRRALRPAAGTGSRGLVSRLPRAPPCAGAAPDPGHRPADTRARPREGSGRIWPAAQAPVTEPRPRLCPVTWGGRTLRNPPGTPRVPTQCTWGAGDPGWGRSCSHVSSPRGAAAAAHSIVPTSVTQLPQWS